MAVPILNRGRFSYSRKPESQSRVYTCWMSFLSGVGSAFGYFPEPLTSSYSYPTSIKAKISLISSFATFIPAQGCLPI